MFQRKNKGSSNAPRPKQEQPSTHSERQWHCCSIPYVRAILIFLISTILITDLANTAFVSSCAYLV